MQEQTVDAKWCHLIWSAYRKRKLFNLAGQGAFCERAVRDAGRELGWPVEAIHITDSTARALFRVPTATTRSEATRRFLRAARKAFRQRGLLPLWTLTAWETHSKI